MRKLWIGLSTVLMLSLVWTSVGHAQQQLNNGTGVIGQVSAEQPFVFFNFSGAEGDLVTVRVVGLGSGFSPSLSINSPTGQQIAFGAADATASGVGNVRADVLLPQGGIYNIQVGSTDGSQGQFVIRMDSVSTQNAIMLDPINAPTVSVNFAPGQFSQAITFDRIVDSDLQLIAQTLDVPFSVAVYNMDGMLVGVMVSDENGVALMNLPSGAGSYTAIVSNLNRDTTPIQVSLTTSGGTGAPPPPPPATNDSGTTAPPPTTGDTCTITINAGGANVRSGPGTNYEPPITTVAPSSVYAVTGQNNGWYTINVNGVTGWVAGSVGVLNGPCSSLPFVAAPPLPAPTTGEATTAPPPVAATPTPTMMATTEVMPTDAAPTATMVPPTATEPTVAVAPPDSSYFVDVDITGSQVTVADAVSYPGGDVEDEIFWNAVGFTSVVTSGNIQMIITCTGSGQENVTFRMGTSTFSCGDVTDRFVTNDSDSGLIRVTATGGDNILVNYSILFIGSR
jgi:hypothetical protein